MLKIISLIFLLLLNVPALAAETDYSSVLEDFPLMRGMTELPESSTVFDNPSGRIVEFSAGTIEPAAAVKDFYRHALPSLGWKPAGTARFVRDKEMLKMDFDKKGEETIVHFTVTPAGEK